MRTIIAGSRSATKDQVYRALKQCKFTNEISVVICGMAKGADTHGKHYAIENNIEVLEFPANWNLHGKSAGYKRNVEMAENADSLIAIWDGESKGTKHMIDIAIGKGLNIFIYRIELQIEAD